MADDMTAQRRRRIIDDVESATKPKTKLFQAHVNAELLDRVIRARQADGLAWRYLVEAFFRRYLEERSSK